VRNLYTVFKILPKNWRGRFVLLILFFILIGIFEMLGVASIMPFVALLSDPSGVNQSAIGKFFLKFVGRSLVDIPLHYIGCIVLSLFILGNVLGFISLWVSTRFAARLNERLAGDLTVGFFAQGYEFLRAHGTTTLANYSVKEVERAVNGGVLQLCLILSKFFQVTLVAILLAIVSPLFSAIFVLIASIMYSGFFWFLRKKMSLAGEDILNATGGALHLANDLYGASREVLIRGDISYFVAKLRALLRRYSQADEVSRILPMVTKYLIELMAFSMLLALPIYRSWAGLDYKDLLPFIALFTYAGYRLLPNLQQIYSSLSILKFNSGALRFLESSLTTGKRRANELGQGVRVQSQISLTNVSYRHTSSKVNAISEISFTINQGEKVAIIGLSGSGKSTLLDILLGLTTPSHGVVTIDNNVVPKGPIAWARNAVGYAPQSPLLLNASVAENIAFGVELTKIDLPRCEDVAKRAHIEDVIATLPSGYTTVLGVGGVSLSGGESQRLAIARALYPDPSVIVLDEPTSALDPTLSQKVLQSLCSLGPDKTLIAVTHSWESLTYFDKIILMHQGRLFAIGTPDTLVEHIRELRIRERDEEIS
jgi:ATP-binding cassette, subfamily B, bacterial PglK